MLTAGAEPRARPKETTAAQTRSSVWRGGRQTASSRQLGEKMAMTRHRNQRRPREIHGDTDGAGRTTRRADDLARGGADN